MRPFFLLAAVIHSRLWFDRLFFRIQDINARICRYGRIFLFSQKTGGKTAGICLLSLGKSVDETEKICYNMYQRATARRAAKKQSFGSDNREVFQ